MDGKGGLVMEYKCEQCGKSMTPLDYIIGSVCLECCKKNHAIAAATEERGD